MNIDKIVEGATDIRINFMTLEFIHKGLRFQFRNITEYTRRFWIFKFPVTTMNLYHKGKCLEYDEADVIELRRLIIMKMRVLKSQEGYDLIRSGYEALNG